MGINFGGYWIQPETRGSPGFASSEAPTPASDPGLFRNSRRVQLGERKLAYTEITCILGPSSRTSDNHSPENRLYVGNH
jgi:hypothetical protein